VDLVRNELDGHTPSPPSRPENLAENKRIVAYPSSRAQEGLS
jgi:hypothetical protein